MRKGMKKYISPIADVVVLNTKVKIMQEVQGNPRGSYDVNPLNPDNPITIGGDDEPGNANTYHVSLWDED